MTEADLKSVEGISENLRKILFAGSNARFLVDGRWKIYFDEKRKHFVHKDDCDQHTAFKEEAYVEDLLTEESYPIVDLRFICWYPNWTSNRTSNLYLLLPGTNGVHVLDCKTVEEIPVDRSDKK